MRRMKPVLRSWALRVAASGDCLLSEDALVASANQFEDICGVYFLIASGRVMYVGQARQVYARLAVHSREKPRFDAVTVVACDPRDLDVIESLYIHRLRPEWNARRGESMVAPMRPMELWKNRSEQHA